MSRGGVAATLALALALTAQGASWDPVPPSEASAGGPRLDPNAAAELVFSRITVDDSDFPRHRRFEIVRRYRIYDPVRAEALARICLPDYERNSFDILTDVRLEARESLPNGQTRNWGASDVHEQDAVLTRRSRTWFERAPGLAYSDHRERILAVGGLRAGAILDERISFDDRDPIALVAYPLQAEELPIRELQFRYLATQVPRWAFHEFVLRADPVKAIVRSNDAKREIDVTASNLAAIAAEPFAPPLTDRAMTFIAGYSPIERDAFTTYADYTHFDFDPKTAPWTPLAILTSIFEKDRTHVTPLVRSTAQGIVGGERSPREQARRIHNWVSALYQRYVAQKRAARIEAYDRYVTTPDQIIQFERDRTTSVVNGDFVYLEEGLDRSLGLTTGTLLLPDRDTIAFSPGMGIEPLLPNLALRVKIGDQWQFADPAAFAPVPFGAIRTSADGQLALVAAKGQTFIAVPAAPADASHVLDSGHFALNATGDLAGTATRELTGHAAEEARADTLLMSTNARSEYFRSALEGQLRGAEIEVTAIAGLEDPDLPIRINFTIAWPRFARVKGDGLNFAPSVFHSRVPSPFPTEARQAAFQFPYRYMERERDVISMPTGFRAEDGIVPPSLPGRAIDYSVAIGQEADTGKVHFHRDFTSNLLTANASAVAVLKPIFDTIAERDRFELKVAQAASH